MRVRKAVQLTEQARTQAGGLVRPDEWFQFYINPFEALNLKEAATGEELDRRAIRRAKDVLLSDVHFEGSAPGLDNHPLDTSRVHAICAELDDPARTRYHRAVFQNRPLLRFLSRGDIDYFLVTDHNFPPTNLALCNDPRFREFLSGFFSKQFGFVLARAIERRRLSVVEALLSGRRWVLPEHEEGCFDRASRRIDELVEWMRSLAAEGRQRKVSLNEVEDYLREHSAAELFNLLPPHFALQRSALLTAILGLAISINNEHDDPDLAKDVLCLCKRFRHKGAAIVQRLKDNLRVIKRNIAEERLYEARPIVGGRRLEITKEGIRDGAAFFPAGTVRDLRWGMTATDDGRRHEYLFAVRDSAGRTITASWGTDPGGENIETIKFRALTDAALHYLCGPAIDNIRGRLLSGQEVAIGSCVLTREGIVLRTPGWFFPSGHLIGWPDADTEVRNGHV